MIIDDNGAEKNSCVNLLSIDSKIIDDYGADGDEDEHDHIPSIVQCSSFQRRRRLQMWNHLPWYKPFLPSRAGGF